MFKQMITSWPVLLLRRLTKKLWIRVTLMALAAVIASAGAMLFENHLPGWLRQSFGPDAVLPVLTILASGMLAVSTFSLNVMVSAYRGAATQVTPRAHRILLGDPTTQTVLATFIGAFVYSLSAIILLRAGLHAEGSSVIVMGMTVFVVVLVIMAMIRWIDHLSDLGSMDATLRTIEDLTRTSLLRSRTLPALSAHPLTKDTVIPTDAHPLTAPASGYIQVIGLSKIAEAAQDPGAIVWLTCGPGRFVLEGQQIGHVSGLNQIGMAAVQSALVIGDERTFEQDANFGLLVLSETASRALSPGINDPGSAIDVIARQEKLLWDWAHTELSRAEPKFPQIFINDVEPANLIENAFAGIARDGAGMVEVVRRLLNALNALQDVPDAELAAAARDMAKRARDHANAALTLDHEKARIAKD